MMFISRTLNEWVQFFKTLALIQIDMAKVQFVNISQTLSHFLSCLLSHFLSHFLAHSLSQLFPFYFSHCSLAFYCQYSLTISGQSLDSTNSRAAPPSCTIYRRWYLGPWCPCRAWLPPCPPGSWPGQEARQGRRVNDGGSLSPIKDQSLSGAIFTTFFYHSKLLSKHRPSGPILSISRFVRLSVCLSVRLCVCVFTFEVPFNGLFAPTS